VPKYGLAVAVHVLVEPGARAGWPKSSQAWPCGLLGGRVGDRHRSIRSKAYRKWQKMAAVANAIERSDPVVIANDRLTIDDAGRERKRANVSRISGKRQVRSLPGLRRRRRSGKVSACCQWRIGRPRQGRRDSPQNASAAKRSHQWRDRIRAVTSTDAAANGLNTNTELSSNGSQANSASPVGGADGRAPRGMDCRPTDRRAALGALALGPRHAGHHALSDDRALSTEVSLILGGVG